MKKLHFTLLLSVVTTFLFAQAKFAPKEIYGQQAAEIWQGAEHIWLKQQNAAPAFIQFRNGQEPDEETFFFVLRKTFHIPASFGFRLTSQQNDDLGWQHKRYQLTINNIPVSNGFFLVHLINGKVKKYNGYLFNQITVATTPMLAEAAALSVALAYTGAQQYKWQLPEEEKWLKEETGNNDATYYPKGETEIVQLGGNASNTFALAWKFDVYAQQPFSRNYVYVDALTGKVIKTANRIHEVNTTGTATTVYRGNRSITTDSYNGQYRLKEVPRGNGIHTYNMQRGSSYGGSVEFLDANNIWNNVNANLDQYATDAHWGGEMTYDFYTSMGRNSIDNAGFALNLYMHYNTNYVNAFWDGTRMTFGDGNTTYKPLVSLDITGHEISHGLTERTSGLDYQDESGALNESFSDIFGTAVEWYADSTRSNWLIGEDIGSAFRSMSNPNAYGDPDTYNGTNWYNGTADNGGVHTNSSVQNHWYYRLAQGGSGTNDIGNAFNVTGIGRYKATRIAWRNDVIYLTSTADYADARFYAIQSANDLYGVCSPEAIATTKAWYAVGVGGDFVYGTSAQFTGAPVSGCTVPFTVNFTNTSTNTSGYVWSFGDGGTSTALNPSHTYTSLGTYTVKLIADGGACGVDSLVRSNYVSVSTSNPCVVVMPSTGSYQTQTACTGTVYDNGGASANYTDNTNSTLTIAPTGASQVRLHFTAFNMEANYDYLYVYDGPTTGSPVIGSYTGTTIPADITSTGSAITIRQYTDVGVVASGYAIQWACINPSAPPVADFKADVTQSCEGTVKFTDLSTGGANVWLWNFGDGATSTLQHPTHYYVNNGSYTVSLKATNTFGNNTATKNAYISIVKPAGPSVAGPSNCGPASFSLNVSDNTKVTWFDTLGNIVYNGTPFVTPVLNTTTTYYVQDTVEQQSYQVGPATNAIGQGAIFNTAARALVFKVFKKSKLVSVQVYAQGDAYRTIQYRDSLGGVIASKTVFIPDGSSRITLNIDLLPGGPYELGVRDTLNLYRNSTGAAYPYNDANGIVSITGNNASGAPSYYYFFYDWEVKENDCISQRVPVTATINPALTLTAAGTNLSCNGIPTGAVTTTATGGTPVFNYLWSNTAGTASLSNLSAGTYSVTATDAAGCSATASRTITQPLPVTPSVAVTNLTCNGGNNGALAASATGGTGNFVYNWSGGIATPTRSGLVAGSYPLTVTDANNCSATTTATLLQPTAITIATTTGAAACGQSNGSVTTNVTNGSPVYTYHWSNGEQTPALNSVAGGTYNLTVTDQNLCTATATAIVTSSGSLAATASGINATCYGSATGEANVSVTTGNAPYMYTWSNGLTTAGITNVAAGTYTATVTDASGCVTTVSQTISEPAELNISVTPVAATCGGANGSASAGVSGGTGGYIYLWSNNSGATSITGLTAGSYSLVVTDANGCSASAAASVGSNATITATITGSNVSCYGSANGNVSVNVGTGTQPYTYQWSNGANTATLNSIAAGTYTATVTDASGCVTTVTQTISEPTQLNVSVTPANATCGANNGSVNAVVSGGTQGYSYLWSNSSGGSVATGLAPGTYQVTVTDANGCSVTSATVVNSTTGLSAVPSVTNVTCYGLATGSASVLVNSGTQPYTYLWSNGGTSASISAVAAGSYSVTITDGNNCSGTQTVTIAEPPALTVNATARPILCHGQQNGTITAVAAGGTSGYSYLWCNGTGAASVQNLAAGNCAVTVTDANGCSVVQSVLIEEPDNIQFATSTTNAALGASNGSVLVTNPTGGVGPYSFTWSTGDTTQNLQGLGGGTYTISVTDANGCVATANLLVQENPDGITGLTNGNLFRVYPNPATTELTIEVNGFTTPGQLNIVNVLGQNIMAANLVSAKTNINLEQLAAGVYMLELQTGKAKLVKQIIIAR